VIKLHPAEGADMTVVLDDPQLTAIVRHHHERLDGTGYPDRLSGEAIPLGARIIAVADTFDAITSTRPYRGAAPHKRALEILRQESGAQLDPDAVRASLSTTRVTGWRSRGRSRARR
jgi:HD-GYP domain-containing protein (c-di-GMP phosphodiesterase class II)